MGTLKWSSYIAGVLEAMTATCPAGVHGVEAQSFVVSSGDDKASKGGKKRTAARQGQVAYHVSAGDAELRERGRSGEAPLSRLAPRELPVAGDDGHPVTVHERGALQEAQRRERHVVGCAPHGSIHCSVHVKWDCSRSPKLASSSMKYYAIQLFNAFVDNEVTALI